MKKRLFSILLSICMVFTMIPMAGVGVFAETATTSIPASAVSIGNATLNNTDKYYYNGDATATSTLKEGETPNATFSNGTLTLNNLNVTNANGIRWDSVKDSKDGSYNVNLTIKLEPYSDNTVVSTEGSAIVGANGETANGPSLTIEGSGALHLTGKTSGIWVWKNITIAESTAVDIKAQGQTSGVSAGICNNTTGVTTIKDNAYVKIDSATYGIAHSSSDTYRPNNDTVFTGGSLLINAGTAAMRATPTTAIEASKYDITYNGNSIASSTSLRVEPKEQTYGDTVGIYLRTLDKDSKNLINVPANQLNGLGITYYDHDSYGDWVDFGSYRSVKAKAYRTSNGTTTGRYDETVKAVVNETKAAAIDKNTDITFDRLDAVTWDTMSKSNNYSDGTTWHLNGEIPLCEVNLDLNYDGADSNVASLTRYAVKGTEVNTGLPTPTRTNYKFNGWYTTKNDGKKITKIPVLEEDVTYYAQWTAAQTYTITYETNGGEIISSVSNVTNLPDTLPTPQKEKYDFAGWYTDEALTTLAVAGAKLTGDITLYAKWIDHSHTFSDTWNWNDESHWHDATCGHNTAKGDYGKHAYGTTGDERYICTTCRYTNEARKADVEAADNVTGLINAIGNVEYTDASKAKIDAAREAYNSLTEEQKSFVDNKSTLTDAEAAYENLKTAADTAAAAAAVAKINAIEEVEYTDESKAKIEEARAAYDALTNDQKAKVTAEQLKVLTDAEAAYADLKAAADQDAANAVIALIDAIGNVEYTDASKAKIDAARDAYDKLTDDQKQLVNNYSTLTEAEKRYEELANTRPGHYKPTQKPEIIAGEGTKAGLTLNGTKATITVEEGYEITDVLVNGVSLGKVTEITGLKTGDKVEIKTAKKQTEPEFNVKNYVKELTLAARSSKTAKGNIRIKVASVTDENGNPVDLSELKAKGYTVKYKFYRSEKKAAEYGARIEKDTDNNSYINNTGKKGAKYFYKVRVMVYDSNGNLAAKSELKQCKYATRIWSK